MRLRGIFDFYDANFAHSMIDPVRKDIIFDHEMLNNPSRIVGKRIVATNERILRELFGQKNSSSLPPPG